MPKIQHRTAKTPRHPQDGVRAYLEEIGRIPLLTPEQEITYGKQVQQLKRLLTQQDELAQQLSREPTQLEWAEFTGLSATELTQTLQQGYRAQQRMIESNLRLVVSIAKDYQQRGLELLDLVQEGTLGLQRAVEKFDVTKGYKFSTYAYWWIRQGLTRAIALQGRTIRLPVHIHEKLNRVKKVRRQLTQQLGRSPHLPEVAAAAKMEVSELRSLLAHTQKPISLDIPVNEDRDTNLQELLADPGPLPEEVLELEHLSRDLEQCLEQLTSQSQTIVGLRYGKGLSFTQMGGQLNLSREGVRLIERKALGKLRQHAEGLGLSEFF